ncbi:MAG: ABC transporter ATP-binding protein [Acidobacteriota bacterium]|nr:ABC transporter ATP-binding protein [Acidobacteriota bacterium]MDE3031106.1 ABC transporter ATP-binding protein [Acidobacteriota bacterium]MDE3093081.1 ABC transporter ATP-binding protein [Acidobacteriota bacterium]MDE3139624.1 ABC transporter ATP-binding protein [Acidobacteriota bacterium]MDE3146939.1 ABC transporter ATP-binding protein [Acidobacteriota bacterium]
MSVELSKKGQVLTATGLAAGYDGRAIVSDIDIEATPGKVISIVGPNGSGKSTLLKSLVGVVRVLDGTVKVGDTVITNTPSEEVAKIGVGYVPQIDDVFPPLSVKENLEIGGYLLARHEIRGRIDAVLEFFPKLKAMMSRKAGKLSGGERKMLAMGRVLMLSPSVLVLDEPTANLAPIVATQLLEEYIRGFADFGSTVLLVEQRAKAALRISDWTYVLGGGRVVLDGAPDDLAQNPIFIESFLGGGAATHAPKD